MKTFEDAASRAADKIHRADSYARGSWTVTSRLDIIDDRLDDEFFARLGRTALAGIAHQCGRGRHVEAIAAEVVALVCRKQHDYGHSNIERYGVEGIKVRMSDKICRIRNLMARAEKMAGRGWDGAHNESLEDAWVDLVGYSIVALMVLEDTFKLPLAADLPKPYVWSGNTSAPFDCSALVDQTFRPLSGGGIPATSLVRTCICENGDTYNWYSSSQSWVFAGRESAWTNAPSAGAVARGGK